VARSSLDAGVPLVAKIFPEAATPAAVRHERRPVVTSARLGQTAQIALDLTTFGSGARPHALYSFGVDESTRWYSVDQPPSESAISRLFACEHAVNLWHDGSAFTNRRCDTLSRTRHPRWRRRRGDWSQAAGPAAEYSVLPLWNSLPSPRNTYCPGRRNDLTSRCLGPLQ
jgi:hypothetical protein